MNIEYSLGDRIIGLEGTLFNVMLAYLQPYLTDSWWDMEALAGYILTRDHKAEAGNSGVLIKHLWVELYLSNFQYWFLK